MLKGQARLFQVTIEEASRQHCQRETAAVGIFRHIQLVDYHLLLRTDSGRSLTKTLQPTRQLDRRELLTAHREQLREWAENYPPTFRRQARAGRRQRSPASKAETLDAMRLYEQAIRSARENGFVQNEGLAL